MSAFGCVPCASVCPCARCVDAMTSPSSSARQTPTAHASCPIATCRKPGSSPARKRSSTCLLEAADQQHLAQEVLEFAPRGACPSSPQPSPRPECTVRAMSLADQWDAIEKGLDPRWTTRVSSSVDEPRLAGARGCAACARRPGGDGATMRFFDRTRRRRCRTRSAAANAAPLDAREHPRHARARRRRTRRRRAEPEPRRRLARGRHGMPRSRTCRLTGATFCARSADLVATTSSAAALLMRAAESEPRRRAAGRLALPLRAQLRLRRLAADGAPLPRAARRGAGSPARCASCARSPTRIRSARRDPSGTSAASSPDGRPRRLADDRARLAGRRAPTASVGQVEVIAATRTPTSSTGSRSRRGALKAAKYVPSEHVGEIVEGEVHLVSDGRSRRERLELPRAAVSPSRPAWCSAALGGLDQQRWRRARRGRARRSSVRSLVELVELFSADRAARSAAERVRHGLRRGGRGAAAGELPTGRSTACRSRSRI